MAAIYDYVGVVDKVLDTQTVGAKGFQKRSLIMTDDVDSYAQYPQHIEFIAKGDRINMLNDIAAGDRVKLRFAIDGRVWRDPEGRDRYFKDLTVLNIEKVGAAAPDAAAPSPTPAAPPPPPPVSMEDDTEMPF